MERGGSPVGKKIFIYLETLIQNIIKNASFPIAA
jgi:hypothetical protein